MIAFSVVSNFEVRLPAGNDNTSILNLFIHIRDTLDCIVEWNMTSVIVTQDSIDIIDFINNINNSFVQLLAGGNQNIIRQIITSFSQEFNQINTENIQNAVTSNNLSLSQ